MHCCSSGNSKDHKPRDILLLEILIQNLPHWCRNSDRDRKKKKICLSYTFTSCFILQCWTLIERVNSTEKGDGLLALPSFYRTIQPGCYSLLRESVIYGTMMLFKQRDQKIMYMKCNSM